jgi:hypothetical protein
MKTEAEEFAFCQVKRPVNVFSKPVLDLSKMLNLKRFMRFLAFQEFGENFGIIVTDERTEICIENLIGVNSKCLGGKFYESTGIQTLPKLFLKVGEIEGLTRIPLFEEATKICDLHVRGDVMGDRCFLQTAPKPFICK